MRILATTLLLLSLAGCAQARIIEWEGKEFTLCGPPGCKADCFQKKVAYACAGKAEQISSFAGEPGFKKDYRGNIEAGDTSCKKFRCDGKLQLE